MVHELVTTLAKWVTKSNQGALAQNSRKRTKRKSKGKNRNTRYKSTQQQTTLRGVNLDLLDNEHFGDILLPKLPGILRIFLLNLNCLPLRPTREQNRELSQFICNCDADILLFQELGLFWPKLPPEDQWSERLHTRANINSNLAYNTTEPDRTEAVQYGGTAVITKNEATHRFLDSGNDPSGLGHWAWTQIQGQENFRTRFVSVYRPCSSTNDKTSTVYQQHMRAFSDDRPFDDPRMAILKDLGLAIQEWQQEGDCVIIGMDANEDVRSDSLKSFFGKHYMREAILERHPDLSPPATHNRNHNRQPIDGIWCNRTLTATRAGYFPFNETLPGVDHRGNHLDLTFEQVFGHPAPPLRKPAARRLKSGDP